MKLFFLKTAYQIWTQNLSNFSSEEQKLRPRSKIK